MTLRGATFLGVGSMVGAGIFALLGEAGAVAGSATWLSFVLAGALAALLGYVVVTLGARYPSSGGFIEYVRQAFGVGHVLGIASWLTYFALVVIAAMVAVAFGEYTASFLFGGDILALWVKVFATAVVVVMTVVNLRGSSVVDTAQSALVVAVLGVFAIFIVSTFGSIDSANLARDTYPTLGKVVASIALTFFAYMGFAVITFSAGDLANPRRDMPRATYAAIGIASVTYVAIAACVFGVLGTDQVIASGTTAIAEAAKPVLGDAGLWMMTITAMLATAGCTNANLYGASQLTRVLGASGMFPAVFSRTTERGRPAGLLLTAGLTIAMSVGFDLAAIASIGTAVALSLFLLLAIGGMRLRHETGAHPALLVAAGVAVVVVLVSFLAETIQTDPVAVVAMAAVAVLAIACDYRWTPEVPADQQQGGGLHRAA